MKLLFTCVLAATLAAGIITRAEQLTGTTTSSTTSADKTKARTIEIVGTEKMKFDQEEIVAKPGETLRIVLKAVGSMPKAIMAHNFVLLKAGVDATEFNKASFSARDTDFIAPDRKGDVIAATGLAGAGETVEVTFKVPAKPGNYNFICSFPGHFAMGMRGKLVVK